MRASLYQQTTTTDPVFVSPSAPPPPYEEVSTPLCKPDDSCIEFSVSSDSEHRIMRADRKAILDTDTPFRRMILDHSIKLVQNRYEISCKTVSSFELYIRHLETNFIRFSSIEDAQDVLELCLQFPNDDLLKRCVSYLDFHIAEDNVVRIYKLLKTYNNNFQLPAPTKRGCCKPPRTNLETMEHHIAALQENCLQFIDQHSETVFKQDDMLELRYDELSQIVTRPTLELTSELVLVELLATWSWKQCEKKRLDISDENRRAVLGALCYTPRFLAMPTKLFPILCERIRLLDANEEALIGNILNGKKCSNLTSEQLEMVENFKRFRPRNQKPKPIHLSDRSHPKKSRRSGKDYYARKKCTLGDCLFYTLCVCCY